MILQIALGVVFLWAGIGKFSSDFTAEGYLLNATAGPFKDMFMAMAGSALVDGLVMYGQVLIGAALVLGVFTRFAAYSGALMMVLFYLSVLPPEQGYITQHIIYALGLHLVATFSTQNKFAKMIGDKMPALKQVL